MRLHILIRSGNSTKLLASDQLKHCSTIYPIVPLHRIHARRRWGGGGSRGPNEPPLEANNGGLKTFQLLANSGGMENKL